MFFIFNQIQPHGLMSRRLYEFTIDTLKEATRTLLKCLDKVANIVHQSRIVI